MARPEKVRLGDLLVQQKLISQDQLRLALEQQQHSGRKLGRVLADNAFVTEEQISEALANQLNIPYINLKYYNINPQQVRLLPENQARSEEHTSELQSPKDLVCRLLLEKKKLNS